MGDRHKGYGQVVYGRVSLVDVGHLMCEGGSELILIEVFEDATGEEDRRSTAPLDGEHVAHGEVVDEHQLREGLPGGQADVLGHTGQDPVIFRVYGYGTRRPYDDRFAHVGDEDQNDDENDYRAGQRDPSRCGEREDQENKRGGGDQDAGAHEVEYKKQFIPQDPSLYGLDIFLDHRCPYHRSDPCPACLDYESLRPRRHPQLCWSRQEAKLAGMYAWTGYGPWE